ncbi:hypothetical protein EDD21DRAFT_387274 [Dissophora ornata]|nr:hypothetical protein EDD21DRAFT_387274 [Dissophora ornata]
MLCFSPLFLCRALDFIFDYEYTRKYLASEVLAMMPPRVPALFPANEEVQLLSECSIFAATHSFLETKQYFRNHIQEGTFIEEVLRAYTTRPSLWQDPSLQSSEELALPRNEDTHTDAVVRSIVIGVFGDFDVVDHWGRDPIPTPQGFEEKYIPAYYAEKAGLPFIVVEVKKLQVEPDMPECDRDRRKLPCMMKIMLDRLLAAGVPELPL